VSGHSKWANIKRKKEANDERRGKIFTKLSRLITLAVVEGGGIPDPEKNVKLRLIIEKAKASNMPKENISRAVERATSNDAKNLKELIYEGFGVQGVSILIVCTTDNSNRSYNDVRSTLEKLGGKIGSPGSAIFNFQKCGIVIFNKTDVSEDELMQITENIEAFDIEEEEESYVIYFPFEKLGHLEKGIGNLKQQGEVYYRPLNSIKVTQQQSEELMHISEVLEDLDDVQKVYMNVEIQ